MQVIQETEGCEIGHRLRRRQLFGNDFNLPHNRCITGISIIGIGNGISIGISIGNADFNVNVSVYEMVAGGWQCRGLAEMDL